VSAQGEPHFVLLALGGQHRASHILFCSLWVGMLQACFVPVASHTDSSGVGRIKQEVRFPV
jgi:hypothetical protein